MRLSKRKRPGLLGFPITSMIDVVFLLLIFFMAISQQSSVDKSPIELPKLKGAVDQDETTLTVNVGQDDRIFIGGDPRELAEFDRILADTLKSRGHRAELVRVVVRVDRRADSAMVNRLMVRLKRAGIAKVRLAVEAPSP